MSSHGSVNNDTNFLSVQNARKDGNVPDESGVWSPNSGSGPSRDSRPSSSEDADIFFMPLPPTGPNVYTGTVEKIFATYGFIVCSNGSRYFFHFGTCVTKPEYLAIGDEVDFVLGTDKKSGRTHAQRLYRHPKKGETIVEKRIPYSSLTQHWVANQGHIQLRLSTDQQSPSASPTPYTKMYPLSAPPVRSARKFSFDASSIIKQMANESERCSGFVGGVLPNGDLIIELLDHSRLVYAPAEEVSLEDIKRGSEVMLDVVLEDGGRMKVSNVQKLNVGTLTADFVRGGEKKYGHVVKELNLDESTSERLIPGIIETTRRNGEYGSVRRYPFTLTSLPNAKELSLLSLGSTVTFYVQAEGSERRAVELRPSLLGADALDSFGMSCSALNLSTASFSLPSSPLLSNVNFPLSSSVVGSGRVLEGARDTLSPFPF